MYFFDQIFTSAPHCSAMADLLVSIHAHMHAEHYQGLRTEEGSNPWTQIRLGALNCEILGE